MSDAADAVPGSVGPDTVAVIWDEGYLAYDLGGHHPLHPVRLALTMDLARCLGVLDGSRVRLMAPTPADDDTLELAHAPDYVNAVRRAPEEPFWTGHGLGTPDNPIFPHMHESAALIAGGSVLAAEQVWTGRAQRAVNIAGGLH